MRLSLTHASRPPSQSMFLWNNHQRLPEQVLRATSQQSSLTLLQATIYPKYPKVNMDSSANLRMKRWNTQTCLSTRDRQRSIKLSCSSEGKSIGIFLHRHCQTRCELLGVWKCLSRTYRNKFKAPSWIRKKSTYWRVILIARVVSLGDCRLLKGHHGRSQRWHEVVPVPRESLRLTSDGSIQTLHFSSTRLKLVCF